MRLIYPQLCVHGRACEPDPDRELQDELSFMLLIGTLESKFEICEQLFSNGSNDKIWDDHIYPIIAKQIEESLQRPSTELSNVEVEERYPGMMQSELWRNVCGLVLFERPDVCRCFSSSRPTLRVVRRVPNLFRKMAC